jgi:hypothetical protein
MAPGLTPVWWMAAGSVCSALVLTAISSAGPAIWMGMIAPLAVAAISWVAMERVYRTHPERLNAVMLRAFAVKLIFFGVYVTLAIRVVRVEPVAFVLSLAGYFIVLHLMEALWMKRLFIS